MENKDKIIYDFCGGTGAWSRDYANAGYTVILVTLPKYDVRDYIEIARNRGEAYGVLAAVPCTHFSVSGAQYWKQKDTDGRTLADTQIITAVLIMIAYTKPVFWCIENPVGRMNKWLGKPVMYFNPCDYGDPYTKKTALWGQFNIPVKNPVKPIRANIQGSWIQSLGGKSEKTKEMRSITPAGFTKAFFEANQ